MPHLKRNSKLERTAEGYYSPELPYHNFGHIRAVLEAAEGILDRCETAGVPADFNVVYYALLFHDAGYIDDHRAEGFESKEAYSAHIAERELRAQGVKADVIEKVKRTILSTERDASFETNEEKIVRAADLSEIAADFETFRRNTENLKKETEFLTGATISWDDWLGSVQRTIEFYCSQRIHITSSRGKTETSFHNQARKNLAQLKKQFGKKAA
ncbi:MAG: HD domain-containing protein [Bdellovibrionales bacterium]|nr:HD domain-containing protein [Bdellovibrionales bacterium]